MPPHRVALGAIFTECNQFGGLPITLDWFERYELRRGDEILASDGGVVRGMLDVLEERGAQPVPLLFASTCPGGPLTADCYQQLKSELLQRLQDALPVDGVLLPLHGAAVVEGLGDLEGDLIQAVRAVVGPDMPIVGTLDLHAHISAAMVEGADALVAWETYPHRDTASTGQRGARLLLDTLDGLCKPTMAMAKVPIITSAIHAASEGDDPFARLMRWTKAHEERPEILSTSLILVHPNLDLADLGSGGLVVTDNDPEGAADLARQVAKRYWALRNEFEPALYTPAQAIAAGRDVEGGPVILVEAADCCGGGAAGDSVATLAALLEADFPGPALVPVVDAEAATALHKAGTGAQVQLKLGHRHDLRWSQPIDIEGTVTRLFDGRFTYVGGIWDGSEGNMGPSGVLEIGPVQVLVTTHGTYDWMDEQFLAAGLNPAAAQFIVAKNPMNYRQAYGAQAGAVFILDTPGPTPATMRHIVFENFQRPYFPLDEDIPGLAPTILQ
ncbi:MAG: hypothetical protein GKR89_35205 [Candidatus Latescibacteria bacterium]|nr:hypothetical protein [Candidatus Latescibacterota bacterium]